MRMTAVAPAGTGLTPATVRLRDPPGPNELPAFLVSRMRTGVTDVYAAGGLTVRVAALVVAVPTELVNTARYWLPLIATVVLGIVSVVEVAPARSVKVIPFVETCHCTVGVGPPDADAVNAAVTPAVT